jgi:hypothetical protein
VKPDIPTLCRGPGGGAVMKRRRNKHPTGWKRRSYTI